jgi:hypothetical protein
VAKYLSFFGALILYTVFRDEKGFQEKFSRIKELE